MPDFNDTAFASGAIASFNNGADDVPMSSVVAHIAPTLTGTNAVNMVQSGKNLLENQETSRTESDVTFTKNGDGSVSLSGTASADINYTIYSNFEFPKLGQYVISGCPLGGSTSTYRIFATNYGSDTGSGLSVNVTSLSTKTSIRINIKSGTNTNGLTFKPMVEVGSSASAFEKYSAPTTHTASLGRTIYGGTADIVTGEGSETYGKITDFNTLTANGTSSTGAYRYKLTVSNMPDYNTATCVSNILTYRASFNANAGEFYNATNVLQIFLTQDNVTDAIAYLHNNNVEIVYPKTTPTPFTFTPITPTPETAKGSNTFWSDQGNTELTYYKDGYGTTSVTIHKETPDGEPVEETRKLHRIIYEGQVDVISGTGLIYRGESGTQYDPPEQISFTPIDVSTDEGENTLYADEGNSAITYRKAVE